MEKVLEIAGVLARLLAFVLANRDDPETVEKILGAPLQLTLARAVAKAEADAKYGAES